MEKLRHTDAFLTDRIFDGSFHNANDGEFYWTEYENKAVDDDGKIYRVTWHFQVIKGHEPKDDQLPWHDLTKIIKVERI